jgi:hypothetical protein
MSDIFSKKKIHDWLDSLPEDAVIMIHSQNSSDSGMIAAYGIDFQTLIDQLDGEYDECQLV